MNTNSTRTIAVGEGAASVLFRVTKQTPSGSHTEIIAGEMLRGQVIGPMVAMFSNDQRGQRLCDVFINGIFKDGGFEVFDVDNDQWLVGCLSNMLPPYPSAANWAGR